MTIPRDFLDKLACPTCKGPLEITRDDKGLACGTCEVVYPIVDGIPALIKDQAMAKDEYESRAG